jgi:hypothetical protein
MPGGYLWDDFPDGFVLTVDPSRIVRAVEVVVDPQYDAASGLHDAAVVVVPAGAFGAVEPVRVARPGALDALASHGRRRGPQFTPVG